MLIYEHSDTGEQAQHVFKNLEVLRQQLRAGRRILLDPPVWVRHGNICFDPDRVSDLRFSEPYDALERE